MRSAMGVRVYAVHVSRIQRKCLNKAECFAFHGFAVLLDVTAHGAFELFFECLSIFIAQGMEATHTYTHTPARAAHAILIIMSCNKPVLLVHSTKNGRIHQKPLPMAAQKTVRFRINFRRAHFIFGQARLLGRIKPIRQVRWQCNVCIVFGINVANTQLFGLVVSV